MMRPAVEWYSETISGVNDKIQSTDYGIEAYNAVANYVEAAAYKVMQVKNILF